MRTPLDSLVTEHALRLVNQSGNADFTDAILDGCIPMVSGELPVKNVCAKVHPWLSDEIDKVVDLLGISKRRFLEAAFIEAVNKANAIIEAEGVHERFAAMAEAEAHAAAESVEG
ncbi:hypothetical protein [Candidatus Protochlamydia amoebophila]|jgi:hypothetical protein|uniref:hypothetical protein n=3 Tax=Bacteria TaxID=2 RepID=UPI001BC9BADC|nr:hypothetical protein [Candidatus Protochlamydia amoebophila]